jgi:endonuclease YncB( thermonuclease family)
MRIRLLVLINGLLFLPITSCGESSNSQDSKAIVTKVVDGDTVWVKFSNGSEEKVRLIGIDTPETGQRGFEPAKKELETFVLNKEVTLVVGGPDNRDKYERLLRYIDINGLDAGLELIKQGLAIHRYDSTDNYGKHAREAAYVNADQSLANTCE